MRRWTAGLIAAGLLVAGAVVVLALRSQPAARTPGATPAGTPAVLDGEMADRFLPQVLEVLRRCLAQNAGPATCQRSGDLRFVLAFHAGQGRVEQLELAQGCLAPPVRRCFETGVAGLRLQHERISGVLNVLFPLTCDGQGLVRLPSLALQGRARRPAGSRPLASDPAPTTPAQP